MTPPNIQTYGTPPAHAHYVPATGYGGLVFASGQLPRLADGTHTAGRRRIMFLPFLAMALIAATPPKVPPPIPFPQGEALTRSVAAASDQFYALFFDSCDPDRLRKMVTVDVEMYDDIRGVRAGTVDGMVYIHVTRCTADRQPGAVRMRRSLVAGSRGIWPVPGYGAIEEARHDFYLTEPGKPERKVETARYLILWIRNGNDWRVRRIFSYDHKLVGNRAQ